MNTLTLSAPAKVNLSLRILGKLENGYHEMESFMQSVSLCDTVTVSWEPLNNAEEEDLAVTLDPGRSDLPSGRDNIAFRAAEAMHREFHAGKRDNIDIKIQKKIPVAAGLAGGSADGAAVIAALALLWGLAERRENGYLECSAVTLEKLRSVAASIGSDLPFCLMNHFGVSAAVATGTGTKIEKAESVSCTLALVTPGTAVSTKAVYGELSPADYKAESNISASKLCVASSLKEKIKSMGNDLAKPALRLFPSIADTLRELENLSEKPLYVQLSGSGPTCFALYEPGRRPDEEELAKIAEKCSGSRVICAANR